MKITKMVPVIHEVSVETWLKETSISGPQGLAMETRDGKYFLGLFGEYNDHQGVEIEVTHEVYMTIERERGNWRFTAIHEYMLKHLDRVVEVVL